jgi:hypothetical protein
MPSLAVELEEGVQRMIELSDEVDSRIGSEVVEGDHEIFVTPDSWPMRSASSVMLYRDGLKSVTFWL